MSVDNDPRVEVAAKAMMEYADRTAVGDAQARLWWTRAARVALAAVDAVNPPPRYEQVGWASRSAAKHREDWVDAEAVVMSYPFSDDDVPVFVRVSDDTYQFSTSEYRTSRSDDISNEEDTQ